MMVDKQSEAMVPSEPSELAIIFRLDRRSGVPTYLQLVHQVEHSVRLGYLVQGDQLPRVKDVVSSLTINPNTVLKAYRCLEQKGLISARPGQGTFVSASVKTIAAEDLSSLRQSLITGWLQEAAALALDEEQTIGIFMSALRDSNEVSSNSEDFRSRRALDSKQKEVS